MRQLKPFYSKQSSPIILSLRLAWLVIFLLLLFMFIGGIPARFEDLQAVCRSEPCVVLSLQAEEAQALADSGFSMSAYAAFHIVIELITGGFIAILSVLFFWKRFDDPMGILVAYFLMLFSLNFMSELDGAFVLDNPSLLQLQNVISSVTVIPLILLLFVFPDGRFVPRWTWIVVVVISILVAYDSVFAAAGFTIPSGQFSLILVLFFLPSVLLGIGTQIYRYRAVSNPAQRQQTKWVLFGFIALMVPFLGWVFFIELFPLSIGLPRLIFNTFIYGIMAAFLVCFPISFVIAITRYRLWDIDLLIRRTLVYSVLTGSLVLVYFGSVVVVQSMFNVLTGQEKTSQLTIALSTLLIAALFNPLRRRVQAFIDQRFYRRSYDAVKTLGRFARTARDETDIEQLSAELLQVAQEAMQPNHISLWIKPDLEK